MVDIYTLGIKVDSTGIKEGKKSLDDLVKSAEKADAEANKLSDDYKKLKSSLDPAYAAQLKYNKTIAALSKEFKAGKISRQQYNQDLQKFIEMTAGGTRNLGNFGGAAGRVGIQVQQLAGQIQGGTNAFVALSQQAADIGIVMGLPLLGVVASFGAMLVGSLVPSLFKTEEATKDLIDRITEAAEGLERITEAQRTLATTSLADDIKKEAEALAELNSEREHEQMRLAELNKAYHEQYTAAIKLSGYRKEEALFLAEELLPEIAKHEKALATTSGEYDTQAQHVKNLKEQLEILLGVREKTTKQEEEDAVKASEAWEKRLASIRKANAIISERYDRQAQQEEMLRQRGVSALVSSLMTQEQLENQRYNNALATLETTKQQELTIIGGYDAAKELLAQEHEARLTAITNAEAQKRFAIYSNTFNAVGGLFVQLADARYQQEMNALRNTENMSQEEVRAREEAAKAAFENSKKLQQGLVVINTGAAIMNELATNPNPFAKWANVTAIAATGATQLSKIASQTFGGGGNISSVPAQTTNNTTTNTANVTFNISDGGNPNDVISAIQNYIGDGGILFTGDTEQGRVISG